MKLGSNWQALQSATKADKTTITTRTKKTKNANVKDTKVTKSTNGGSTRKNSKVKKDIKNGKASTLKDGKSAKTEKLKSTVFAKRTKKIPAKPNYASTEDITTMKSSKVANLNTSTKDPSVKTFQGVVQYAQDHDVPLPELIQMIKASVAALPQRPPFHDLDVNDDTSLGHKKRETGKYLSMDCEFVGIGPDGEESALARVSIVNYFGHVVLDEYVQPSEKVTDWRTWVSGITAYHLKKHCAVLFKEAQLKVAALLEGRVLVGHAVHHDLDKLFLSHPKSSTRDTSRHPPYRQYAKGKTPSLKKLAKEVLGVDIQTGQHSSVEDARVTMLLYRLRRKEFEKLHRK